MELRLVYVTVESREEAASLGRALVEARLAACANIIDGMNSIYWWEGAVQEANEVVLILKTRATLVPDLVEKVKSIHSYDCPCVVALPILEGNQDYLEWLLDETSQVGTSSSDAPSPREMR